MTDDGRLPIESRLVDPVRLRDLQCAICLGLLRAPKQCKNGHLFCDECISAALLDAKRCPQCRIDLGKDDLSRALFVENHLRSLPIWCANHYRKEKNEWVEDPQGCPTNCPMIDLDLHQRDCDYAETWCTYSKQCGPIRKRNLAAHKAVCPWRPVECQYCRLDIQALKLEEHQGKCGSAPVTCPKCSTELRRGDLPFHLQRSCPENAIQCPYGCTELVVRKELKQHLEANVIEHLESLRLSQQKAVATVEASFQAEIAKRDLELDSLRRNLRQETRVVWVIENWPALLAQRGYAQSKPFPFAGRQWYFGAYSDGDTDDSRGYVAIYLFLDDMHLMKNQSIFLEFSVKIINHKDSHRSLKKDLKTSFPVKGAQGWGDRKAFSTELLTEEAGFIVGGKILVDAELQLRRITFQV